MSIKLFPYILFFQFASTISWCQKSGASLIGVWKMVADQEVDSTGRVKAEDTTVRGLLIYTAAGKMSAQTQWPKLRRPIMSDLIMNGDGVSFGLGAACGAPIHLCDGR